MPDPKNSVPKPATPRGAKFSLTTRILVVFLSLVVVSLAITAAWLACWLARTIIRPVKSIAEAAQAMEKGALDGAVAATLGRRQGKDEVSALSRVFARMASEVAARESRLKKQMEDLQIEIDQAKNARRTAEIVETDFFRTLKEKAQQMREK